MIIGIKRHRHIDTKPFDRNKMPPKQNFFMMPLIWLACLLATRTGQLKIKKERMEGLKPPFLVLGTHQAFMDFCVTPLALFPYRANYISELEGFEYYGETLYRQIGCLGTRKFVDDLPLVHNIKRVIDRKGILVVYPEARYANVGTTAVIPESVGKLVKLLKVPVVVINMKGNYLQSPIWNLAKRKEARLEATVTQIFTTEEGKNASIEEINHKIREYLTYDEYAWQYEQKIEITDPKRAEGIELPLYQCPICNKEFQMKSKDADLYCKACGSRFHMDTLGKMCMKETVHFPFSHIPDWYEWERTQVQREIDAGKYGLQCKVHIEALPNAKNFIDLGTGLLKHSKEGFDFTFTEYGEEQEKTLHFTPESMLSVHTEYDYRGNGQCITLSTLDNTYFLFPLEDGFNATKIQFATEYLFQCSHNQKR